MGRLKQNIMYNFIYQILIMVLPFITAPYLSRKIGASGVGVYSFSQTVATYFTYITTLGLSNYGNRSIASVQNDREKRSKSFSEIYCMQALCFLVSIILYAVYIIFFSVDKIAALIMSIWVVSSLFDINWLFFGLEKFKLTVIRNTLIKVLSVGCIFLFVKSKDDIYIYILIMALSTFLSQVCLWPYVKQDIDFTLPRWCDIKKHIKPNLILFLPVISVSLYRMMDKIMLGYMCTMEEVGFYENAEKIISMVQSLIVAVGTVMLPRMTSIYSSEKENQGNHYFDLSMTAVIVYVSAAAFGLLSIKDVFTRVYFGSGFERTSEILALLTITLIFFGAGNVLRTQYIIPKKEDEIYIKSAFWGALVNLIVNSILIGKYGGVGAAIGTICAEAVVCIYQFVKVKADISILHFFPVLIRYTVFGLIMYIVIRNLPVVNNDIITLIMYIAVGAAVYLLFVTLDLFWRRKANRHL